MSTMTADYSSSVAPSELNAWKEVHATLTEAVKRAQDAVHAQKTQRRFWMEEICANLTGEGKLKPTSVWKRPVVQKKSAVKKPSVPKPAGTKRKKKDPDTTAKPAKKPRKKKAANNEGESDGPKPKKIKISLKKKTAVPEAFLHQTEEDLDESETYSNDSSGMQQGGYALGPPPPPPGPQWGAPPAHNPLQMMAAVAFGANPAAFPPPMMQQPYNPYYSQQPHLSGMPPHQAYPGSNVRTYSSIHDVGNSDEDSHEDQF